MGSVVFISNRLHMHCDANRSRKMGYTGGASVEEKHAAFLDFETKCDSMKHVTCICCHSTRLKSNMHIVTRGPNKGCCKKCAEYNDKDFCTKKGFLPVWYDNQGRTRYDLPDVLSSLTIAEKMLIQRVSVLVPLTHIVKGTFGLKAHCCAFEQDVDELANTLPRRKDDATVIKVMQTIRAEIGSDRISMRQYKVRRAPVIAALLFLKQRSTEYHDITIDEGNLGWLDGEEGYLDGVEVNTEQEHFEDTREHVDKGPAPIQTEQGDTDEDYMPPFGYVDEGGTGEISRHDADVTQQLKVSETRQGRKIRIVFVF